MKRFIWLLILAAAAYGVWKYYPELERQARSRTGTENAPAEAPGLETLPGALPPATSSAKRAPAPAATVAARDKELAARYPLPEFKPIEALVGGWKKIPASAFPRQVTLKVPATLQLSGGVGTSTLEAGRKVFALAGTPEGALVIAPSQDAVMRGTVPMEATDFKAIMSSVYEDFKKRKRAEIEKLREAARREAASSGPALASVLRSEGQPPPAGALATIGPKPVAKSDSTVPAVVESIAERQRTKKHAEPPAEATLGWGPVQYRELGGEPYWTVSVRYTARTIFGEFPAEALALLRHGKVVKWVYAGTGEPLP
jgi:hypothetical protein